MTPNEARALADSFDKSLCSQHLSQDILSQYPWRDLELAARVIHELADKIDALRAAQPRIRHATDV